MDITDETLRSNQVLKQALFIIRFDYTEQIQREIYNFESKFKSIFKDEAIDTRIPIDHNPSAPRFILRDDSKKRYLEVSQDQAILKLPIYGKYSTESATGLSYFQEMSETVFDIIDKLISPKIELFAVFTIFNFSLLVVPQKEMFKYLSTKFLNTNKVEIPHNFNCSLTYHFDDVHLLKYSLNEYEDFEIKIHSKNNSESKMTKIRIQRDDPRFKLNDYGLNVQIEVNNSLETKNIGYLPDPKKSIKSIFETVKLKSDNLVDFLS